MQRSYEDLLCRRIAEYGKDKFDASELDRRFLGYFESGQRIKVNTCGMVLTGTVGVTTGWKPCFILMRTARSRGGSWTLGPKDVILAVKRGRFYVTRCT